MKKTLRFLLLALLVPLMFQSAKPASAQWFVGVHVNLEPPPLPVYDQPLCPGDGYIWTPGYWAWDADDGYYWVPGTWVTAPEVGFLWTPGYWGWGEGGYAWNEGYWGPHVGFYGGINYGFGYTGEGFWGGRWQGEHFFYNAAVWHVDEVHVRNVYRDETIIRNTTIINNHISYNGGHGGIDRRPTPQEESVRSERHVAPVSEQFRQVEAARGKPENRASMNHGKPEIAATARPGEFSGGGVVRAREAGGEYRPQPGHEAQPVGGGGHPTPAHANDLPQHQPAQLPSTGNAQRDKMYQQQQQKLAERQNQEHQQLQQRQEQEHQQAQQRNFNQQKQQQLEQKHQQETQKLEQQHQQQTQRLQQRQTPPSRENRPKE